MEDAPRDRKGASATSSAAAPHLSQIGLSAPSLAPPSLTAAMRRARVEVAERSEVVAELRGAELARLEMLQEALQPVLSQVPDAIDMFDSGLVPGERPRLFIDMIAFVEMGRDRRAYRFLQDTRHGRVALAESERLETMVSAITDYIGRRIVEREKYLAVDRTLANARAQQSAAHENVAAPRPLPPRQSAFATTIRILVEALGSLVLIALVAGGAYYAAVTALAWWAARQAG